MLNFLTNSTRPEAQFRVNQCEQFSADTNLPYDHSVKRILNYIKGMSEKGLIMKSDPEKDIRLHVYADLVGG